MSKLNAAQERQQKNAVILATQFFIFNSIKEKYGLGSKLENVTEHIGSGATPRGGKAVYVPDGVPFIRSLNVRHYIFQKDNLAFIPVKIDKGMQRTRVAEGDVLLNITGASIGRSCCVPSNFVPANVNQHVSIIRPKQDLLESRFLMYWLNARQTQELIEEIQKGATRQALTKRQIQNFRLPAAPIEHQKVVADFLDAVRTKEDFRSIILPSYLEHIKAIVARIEMLTGKVEEARGLRETAVVETAALMGSATTEFLSSIKDRHEMTLEDTCISIIDCLHSNPRYSDEGIPTLRSPDVGWGTLDLTNARKTDEEEYQRRTRRGEPQKDDIIFVREGGGVGKAGIVLNNQKFSLGQRVMMLRPDQTIIFPRFLLYQLLSPMVYHDQILSRLKGSASPHLNIKALRKFILIVPSLKTQKEIVEQLDVISSKIDALNNLQTFTQSELDALLPSILDKAFKGGL